MPMICTGLFWYVQHTSTCAPALTRHNAAPRRHLLPTPPQSAKPTLHYYNNAQTPHTTSPARSQQNQRRIITTTPRLHILQAPPAVSKTNAALLQQRPDSTYYKPRPQSAKPTPHYYNNAQTPHITSPARSQQNQRRIITTTPRLHILQAPPAVSKTNAALLQQRPDSTYYIPARSQQSPRRILQQRHPRRQHYVALGADVSYHYNARPSSLHTPLIPNARS